MQIDRKHIRYTESTPDPYTGIITIKAELKHYVEIRVYADQLEGPGARDHYHKFLADYLQDHIYIEVRKAANKLWRVIRHYQQGPNPFSNLDELQTLYTLLQDALRFAAEDKAQAGSS